MHTNITIECVRPCVPPHQDLILLQRAVAAGRKQLARAWRPRLASLNHTEIVFATSSKGPPTTLRFIQTLDWNLRNRKQEHGRSPPSVLYYYTNTYIYIYIYIYMYIHVYIYIYIYIYR